MLHAAIYDLVWGTVTLYSRAAHTMWAAQSFPISKLGGWKHKTAINKSSEANQHQALKHLRQYWCYKNWSVIGNQRGRWTFRNWSDIVLSLASCEPTQTNKPPKHYTNTEGHNMSSLKKKNKHTQWVSATIRGWSECPLSEVVVLYHHEPSWSSSLWFRNCLLLRSVGCWPSSSTWWNTCPPDDWCSWPSTGSSCSTDR